ncbi:MAG TPA: FCD domain-containing protein, partial [Thermomicrobiales bacterium]|nr:FCD domain-containing protein [Thermomicrobiales bacterium]
LALSSEYLAEARHHMPRLPDEASVTAEAHDRVVEALLQRDPDASAAAMREHLRSVEEGLGIFLP